MKRYLLANQGPVFSGTTDASSGGLSSGSVSSQQAHTDAMDAYGAQEDMASKDEAVYQSLEKDAINNEGTW